jgi:threonine 3-dehydrogenase
MRAIVKKFSEVGVWWDEVPKPTLKDNEVLIKIHKTSICGTDVHIYKWDAWARKNVPVPLVIGHEFVGVIEQVGSRVRHHKIGDRVTGEGHLTCGACEPCLEGKRHLCPKTRGIGYHAQGCFADYLALPDENVFALPKEIPDDLAAIFDPFGNTVHTVLSFPLTSEDVLITGAGPIGCMAAAVARFGGAREVVVTDVNQWRLALAKKMGATRTVNVKEEELTGSFGLGFEMAGNGDALQNLLKHVKHGGKIALLGILPPGTLIDWDLVIFKMLEIKGIYGREIFRTWHQMCRLLEGGLNISPIITHRFKAEEFQQGFDAMLSGQCGKVILDWV